MKTMILLTALCFLPGQAVAEKACPPPVYMCDSHNNCQWVPMVEC